MYYPADLCSKNLLQIGFFINFLMILITNEHSFLSLVLILLRLKN
jgi:hypothetical protein